MDGVLIVQLKLMIMMNHNEDGEDNNDNDNKDNDGKDEDDVDENEKDTLYYMILV